MTSRRFDHTTESLRAVEAQHTRRLALFELFNTPRVTLTVAAGGRLRLLDNLESPRAAEIMLISAARFTRRFSRPHRLQLAKGKYMLREPDLT